MELTKKQIKRFININNKQLSEKEKQDLLNNKCFLIDESDLYQFTLNCVNSDIVYPVDFDDYFKMMKTKNYKENKALLQDIAINYSNNVESYHNQIDFIYIADFFYTEGKKYGLLKEFKNNAIC